MHRDLLSFGLPVIYVGDHGQLEPIGGDGFNLMADPDVRLEKIHRNAGPIARFADHLRRGGDARAWADPGGEGEGRVEVVTGDWQGWTEMPDQTICAFNQTRVALNHAAREALGFEAEVPCVGDRVMCLQNDRKLKVFNGMQGEIVDIEPEMEVMTFRADDVDYVVRYIPEQFGAEKKPEQRDRLGRLPFDWCYAATAHKCVHPDTLVETAEGLLPIRLVSKTGTVATPVGPRPYRNFVTNPIGPALRIACQDGYEITVTPDHKVESWSGSEWKMDEAGRLRSGAFLRLKLGTVQESKSPAALPGRPPSDVRTVQHDLPTEVTEELAEFFGLMVADGTMFGKGFRLAKRHPNVVQRFSDLASSLFGPKVRVKRGFIGPTPVADVCSALITSWLSSVGGMCPNAKDVPECVMRSSTRIHKAFLRGLFEDGSVNVNDMSTGVSSVYPVLRTKVRTMLLRLGIATGDTLNRPSEIYLYAKNAWRFAQDIGFVADKKNRLAKGIPDRESTRAAVPVDRAFLDEYVLGRFGQRGHWAYRNARRKGYLSRSAVAEFSKTADGEALKALSDLLRWHYVKVRLIEPTECPSMCVEVPDGHRFLQNGFPFGNCQGSEWDAVTVIEQRCRHWAHTRWAYTAASRARKDLVWVCD